MVTENEVFVGERGRDFFENREILFLFFLCEKRIQKISVVACAAFKAGAAAF